MNEKNRIRRLNKIAALLDRHNRQVEIQNCYISLMDEYENPFSSDWDMAFDEAKRLMTYHSKQIKLLQEERELLVANGEVEETA